MKQYAYPNAKRINIFRNLTHRFNESERKEKFTVLRPK